MSKFSSALYQLRHFFLTNYLKPEDVTVTFTFKDAEDYIKFERAFANEILETQPMGETWYRPAKFLGFWIKAEIAKPKKDYAVDVIVEKPTNFFDLSRALNDGILAIRRAGAQVRGVDISNRLITDPGNPDRLCYSHVVRIEGKSE